MRPCGIGCSLLLAGTWPASEKEEIDMKAWNKPKLVEVPVSMEVTMYAIATR